MTVFKPKADYSAIASTYDEARRLPPGTIEQWVALIRDRGKLAPDSICLDLGCGTGRFAIPLAEIPGITVVSADLTEEMLRQAISKPGAEKVYWVRCSAERPAFRHDVFQCVFMSLLLHHVDDMDRVLAECFRSLRPGGVCLVRTTTHEDLDTMAIYRFFPKAREIDRNRLPDIGVIEDSMRRAGFRSVRHEVVVQTPWTSIHDYLEKIRKKSMSALTLLTDEEFAEGLHALETHIASVEDEASRAEIIRDQLTLVIAEKPA